MNRAGAIALLVSGAIALLGGCATEPVKRAELPSSAPASPPPPVDPPR